MKKAQIETMGLVIIVVLLAFILVFVLQLLSNPENNYLNDRYLQLNSDNLRRTILKTNLCSGVNIKDELVNCNDFNLLKCSNLNNCNDLNKIIKTIIENSLNITKNYKFTAGNILVEKGICKNKLYNSASEPIPYSTLNVTLGIC
mgnify:CR=1 FL=1